MVAPTRARNPQAVLFSCGQNSVRSPMAESLLQQMFPHALYVKSAGVKTFVVKGADAPPQTIARGIEELLTAWMKERSGTA